MEKIITLNGRRYVVCNIVKYKGRKFYQLMDIDKVDTIIVEVIDGIVSIVENEDLQITLLAEMVKQLNKKK